MFPIRFDRAVEVADTTAEEWSEAAPSRAAAMQKCAGS